MAFQSAFTREEIIAHALRHKTQKAWRQTGEGERKAGKPSHYEAARKLMWKLGQNVSGEFWQACTARMERAEKMQPPVRTDDELRASAARFSTLSEWKKNDHASYLAAHYQRKKKGRIGLWNSITAHMVPAPNPYGGSYFVYAWLLNSKSKLERTQVPVFRWTYIGLSCRPEDARRAEHERYGPVAEKRAELGADCVAEWQVLERGIPDPMAARRAEAKWVSEYQSAGWSLLNSAPAGSLGTLSVRCTKAELLQRALNFDSRKTFLLGDQSAYRILKKRGWFEEAVAHMRPSREVRSEARTGEKRTAAAKARMRAAKLGGKLSPEHRAKIAAAGLTPEQEARRRAGFERARAEGRVGRPSDAKSVSVSLGGAVPEEGVACEW